MVPVGSDDVRPDTRDDTRDDTRYDTVSFLTDYGYADEFVGVVKSVIRDIAPHVAVVDLTHGVAPFDVRAGSLALARCISYVPSGVVLAVVDPGVATSRRAIAIEVAGGDGVLVGPDNGLLAPAVALAGGAGRVVELTNPEYRLDAPGATFAGRDIFAPAAAHLCNGVDLEALGPLLDADLLVPGLVPLPQIADDHAITQVLWVDTYGNVQLNVGPDDLGAELRDAVEVRAHQPADPTGGIVRIARPAAAFADIGPGSIGIVTDSSGLLTLAMDRRSAAEELGLSEGDQVTLRPADDPADDRDDNRGDGSTASVTLRTGR
jgi:hypothetical protein